MNNFLNKYMIISMVSCLLVMIGSASASVTLLNGGFEDPVVPAGGTATPVVPDWTITGSSYWHLYDAASLTAFTPTVAEGNQAFYLFGGTSEQTLGVIEADQSYTVTFSAAINPGMTAIYSEVVLVDLDNGNARLAATNLGDVITGDTPSVWFDGSLTYETSTYPDSVGHNIGLQINSGTQLLVDNISISSSSSVSVNLLTNGSFETPSLPGGGATPDVTPWTVSAVYWHMYDQASLGSPIAHGLQSLYLYGGTCQQNAGTFEANTVYELTFAVRANTEADIDFCKVAIDDGADGNFDPDSVGGKIIQMNTSIVKSAEQFYYGSLTLDTADPVYAGLVGNDLNVVLHSGGSLSFDDISLTPYASVGTYLLANGGFENPVVPAGGTATPTVPDWTITGATYSHLYDAASLVSGAAEGDQALYLFGGTLQQSAGVIEVDQSYTVTFSVAINPGMTATYSEVVLIDLDDGDARLAVLNLGDVITGDIPSQWFNGSLTYDAATYPASIGHNIALQINSGTQLLIDGVNLIKATAISLGALPENYSTISFDFDSIDTVPLSWTLPVPAGVDPVTCDVYFGTDPANMTKVIENQAASGYVADVSGSGTHYWRVDVIDPAISSLPIRGSLMSFDVEITFPLGDGVNLLTNGSFETPSLPGGGANPDISPWVVDAVYWHMYDAASSIPATDGDQCLYLYGGTCQQDVGVIGANTAYTLTISARANDLAQAPFAYVELLAVPAGGGSPVQLATVNFGDVISTALEWTEASLSFDSAANPSVIGDDLVVNIYCGANVVFDAVNLNKVPSLGASPAEYIAMDVPGSASLSWTLPAAAGSGPVTCDVYVGTDPLTMTKVINHQSQSSYTASFSAYGKYYWIIGVMDPDVNAGEPAYGPVMNFDVIDRCTGAKRLPGFTPLVGDLNYDCEVNLLDLAILSGTWLD